MIKPSTFNLCWFEKAMNIINNCVLVNYSICQSAREICGWCKGNLHRNTINEMVISVQGHHSSKSPNESLSQVTPNLEVNES